MGKTYYLFGETAIDCYHEYTDNDGNTLAGIDAVIQANDENECNFTTFCFVEGVTTPTMLLESYDGWDDYLIITEEEFNKLN